MIKPALCAFILLANFCTAGRAAASVSGAVRTSPVTITLTDLDLTDGITPSIAFTLTVPAPGDTRLPTAAVGFTDGAGREFDVQILMADGTNPISVSRTSADRFSAKACVTGREQLETHVLWSSSSASGSGTAGSAFSNAESGFYDFVLSPNTAVTIEMSAHLSGQAVTGPDNSSVFFGIHLGMWVGAAREYHGEWLPYYLLVQSTVSSLDMHEVLTASYENRSGDPATGFVELAAYTHARYVPPVSSIPEPAPLPAMAVGLGLMGLWARRRGAQHGIHG